MSTLIAIVLALFLGFVLLFGTSAVQSPSPVVEVAVANEPLLIDGEPIERLAQPTGDYSNAYVASSDGLFEQNSSSDWLRIADAPPAGEIIFDGLDADFILVGDEGDCFQGGGGAEFQSSIDGGQSWQKADGESQFIRPLAVWSDTSLVVGAGCEGLLISRDLGQTWTIIADDVLGLNVTGFAVVAGKQQTVLAGLTGEGGTTRLFQFDLAETGDSTMSEPLLEYYGVGALAGFDNGIFVASIIGVSSSYDRGATWTVDRAGLEDVTLERDPLVDGLPADLNPANYGLFAIRLDKGNPKLVSSASSLFAHRNSDVLPGEMAAWEEIGTVSSRIRSFVSLIQEDSFLAQADGSVITIASSSVEN